jgi:hypothetical protein
MEKNAFQADEEIGYLKLFYLSERLSSVDKTEYVAFVADAKFSKENKNSPM